jgi:hypothetical protein
VQIRPLDTYVRVMSDGVALAAVIVAGISVVSSGVIAWRVPDRAAKHALELARENRTQQRLAEAYADVLRIVEREGLYLFAKVCNSVAAAIESEYDPIPRMQVAPPQLTDQASVTALLAAFGSDDVRNKYNGWRGAVDGVNEAEDIMLWNWREDGDPDGPPQEDDLRRLGERHAVEIGARSDLANLIADELRGSSSRHAG